MTEKSDIKSTKAYNILTNLHDDRSIDDDAFTLFTQKLEKMQDCLVNYMEYEKLLVKRLNALKEENTKTLNEYSVLTKQQAELNDKIAQKIEEREQAKSQLNEYETNRQMKSQYEYDRNKEEIQRLLDSIKEIEEKEMAKLQNELDELKRENDRKLDDINKLKNEIQKEEDHLKNEETFKQKLDYENQKKLKEIEEAKETISIRQNEIDSEQRTNSQNDEAIRTLKEQKDKKLQILINIKSQNDKLKEANKTLKDKITEMEKEISKLQSNEDILDKAMKNASIEKESLLSQIKVLQVKKMDSESTKKKSQKELEFKRDNLKQSQLKLSQQERTKTKLDSQVGSELNTLQEEETKFAKEKIVLYKCNEDLTELIKKLEQIELQIQEKEDKSKKNQEIKKEYDNTKDELDRNYGELKNVEKNIIKRSDKAKERIDEIKAKKESIMRTKERLDEETALINEEIQIKELIFLDMTKKYEELRHMYQKYNVLYKTVQAERNKNVVKIQNSNQNRAELKEKMKILTTEMDILDSELSEIYNKIIDKDKDLNKMNTKHNSLKQEINAFGLKNLKYKEEITKLTNENEKLHSIINSIENEMVGFRVDYELACESRNHTGIQLIDRNDELCIFYEKIHHIETRINELYKKILEKEAVVKRSAVEVKEIERFIEVNRKKIPQIPELSNKIKELDTELKILNQTLEKLIKYVENPENNLKYELPGEDLDTNYLKMKYDQLTEMLNEKKEKLLEKELINDEINEIAEKLRKKALEDRGKNLKISKEINEYEIKLNDITRKNVASTSELSMFQAILSKLKTTKTAKEEYYQHLLKRYDNGLLPPKEWLENYQSQKLVKERRKDYLRNRISEVREKENIVIGDVPLRRRPEKRPEEFIEPKTGLPSCVYGKYAPFNPYEDPNNMRHLKAMALKLKKPEENKDKDRVVQI